MSGGHSIYVIQGESGTDEVPQTWLVNWRMTEQEAVYLAKICQEEAKVFTRLDANVKRVVSGFEGIYEVEGLSDRVKRLEYLRNMTDRYFDQVSSGYVIYSVWRLCDDGICIKLVVFPVPPLIPPWSHGFYEY